MYGKFCSIQWVFVVRTNHAETRGAPEQHRKLIVLPFHITSNISWLPRILAQLLVANESWHLQVSSQLLPTKTVSRRELIRRNLESQFAAVLSLVRFIVSSIANIGQICIRQRVSHTSTWMLRTNASSRYLVLQCN